LVEKLFRGYFVEGVDIGDRQELTRLAAAAGLDAYRAAAWLIAGNGREGVMVADERARRLGIAGVPLFIFNRRVMISGAQPTSVLTDAMAQAARAEEGERPVTAGRAAPAAGGAHRAALSMPRRCVRRVGPVRFGPRRTHSGAVRRS